MNVSLTDFLGKFLTEERKRKFEEILNLRTRYITVVLEDIFQPHNASAVLRSCDCFGIQDVHVIENKNKYEVNPDVAVGSSKWLTRSHYNNYNNNTITTINHLRNKGYRIVATTPHKNDVILPEFNLHKGPFALLFGTEKLGLSETAIINADEHLKIPMYGFTESYNVSVSAALCLYDLRQKLEKSDIAWKLSEFEMQQLREEWYIKSVKDPRILIKKYKQLFQE